MNNARAIAAYWVSTFRGVLDEPELLVFDHALAGTAVEDAVRAIDDVAATGGYPPTPQRIAELAEPHRKERLRDQEWLELERVNERALPGDNRPVSFETWLRNFATDDEKATVKRVLPGMRKKFGDILA